MTGVWIVFGVVALASAFVVWMGRPAPDPAGEWIATCLKCGRLIHRDGWRSHPAGGHQVGTTTGTGCKYAQRPDVVDIDGHCGVYGCWAGDCTRRVFTPTGWEHRDCGLALYADAPLPGPVTEAAR